MTTRDETLQSLAADPRVSVLIAGGGINGVGLLRELAMQGVDCLLVDKSDFAAGATSKSSRMIHGGLRYLENRQFALVRESLLERNRLLATAAHYVSPLRTTIPVFSRLGGLARSGLIFMGLPLAPRGRGLVVCRMGLRFYDFVTRRQRRTPTHFVTPREESLRTIPGLNPDIAATLTYWDARITQAERLCIELIDDARRAEPRCRALNYVRVAGIEGGAVLLADEVGGRKVAVRPRVFINATGAWVDRTNAALGLATRYMGGTRGSHLVLDCPELLAALGDRMIYYQHADGRVCIIFPFMGRAIVGSTDIREDDPDAAACGDDEIEYMLAGLRFVFPRLHVSRGNIVFTFCGVRPLPASEAAVVGNISRGHRVEVVEAAATADPSAEASGTQERTVIPSERSESRNLAVRAGNRHGPRRDPSTSLGVTAEKGRPFPVLSLVGGKWTTFRALAEQATDDVLARLGAVRRCSTRDVAIGGGRGLPTDAGQRREWIGRVAAASGLDENRVTVLLDRYGTAAEEFAAAEGAAAHGAAADGCGAGKGGRPANRPLRTLPSYTACEIERIAAREYVEHLADIVYRRSTIGLLGGARPEVLGELAEVVGRVLGWDAARCEEEVRLAAPPAVSGFALT